MTKRRKVIAMFLIMFVGYALISFLVSPLLGSEFDITSTLVVGVFWSGIIALFAARAGKEVVAFVPHAEVKEGIDPASPGALQNYLQQHNIDFQKAKVRSTAEGVEFHFSRLFGWQQFKVVVTSQESALQVRGFDVSPTIFLDDYLIRIKVTTARTLLARQ